MARLQELANEIGVKYVCNLAEEIGRNARLNDTTAAVLSKRERKSSHLRPYGKVTYSTTTSMVASDDDVLANIISEAEISSLFSDSFVQDVFTADLSDTRCVVDEDTTSITEGHGDDDIVTPDVTITETKANVVTGTSQVIGRSKRVRAGSSHERGVPHRRTLVTKKRRRIISARAPGRATEVSEEFAPVGRKDADSQSRQRRRDVFHSVTVRDIGLKTPGNEEAVLSGTFGGVLWFEPDRSLSRAHVQHLKSKGFKLSLSSDIDRIREFYDIQD